MLLRKKTLGVSCCFYQSMGYLPVKLLEVTGSRRKLNLSTADSSSAFTFDGADYLVETFVSNPDHAAEMMLKSSMVGALGFEIASACQLRHLDMPAGRNGFIEKGKIRICGDDPKSPKPLAFDGAEGCKDASI